METREAIAMVFRVSLLFSSIPSFPLGSHRRKKPTSHSWEKMMMMGLVMASTKDLLLLLLLPPDLFQFMVLAPSLWKQLLPRSYFKVQIFTKVFFIWLCCSGNSIKYARVLFSLCTTKYNNNQSQHWRRGKEGKATTNNLKKKIVAWVASQVNSVLDSQKTGHSSRAKGGILWLHELNEEASRRLLLIVPQVLLLLLQLLGNGLCSSQATGDWVEGIKLSSYIGDAKGGVVDGECFQLK